MTCAMIASEMSAILSAVDKAVTPRRFVGRTAVVTGAAAGIGAATARRLAHEGAAVLVVDRDANGADAVCDELRDAGATAQHIVADVADEAAWEQISQAGESLGGVDVLVS